MERSSVGSKLNNYVVIDTNLLLDDPKVIYKLSIEYDKIILPITVLKELDKHKFKPDTSFSAREAIRSLIAFKSEYNDKILFDTEEGEKSDESNDIRIINSAIRHSAVLVTKDMSMSIIAESLGLKVILYDAIINNTVDSYIYIKNEDLFECEDVFSYSKIYQDEDYFDALDTFSTVCGKELDEDSWFFIIINTPTSEPYIYANNPLNGTLLRIDNDPKYRKIIIGKDEQIKALDTYQVCAVYAMMEAPNVLICGSYGSGKSLLSTAYAMSTKGNRKTFISRPNITVDSRFKIGFLPGGKEDKLEPWMAGVISGLYHIFSNTKAQKSDKFGDGPSYDHVKEVIFKEHFDMLSLETVQGISFMDGDLLLLDETQLCSISILATVLSRFGKGSKLIATGDINQVYGAIPPAENGLLKLLRLLPNKNMAYVELKHNYRSGLLELADGLQNKTLF